jgi:hypothetical protein
MKVVERLLSMRRHRSHVAVMRIVAIIYVAVKTMRAMKPGSSSNENSACEPVWTVIAIGSAGVRGIVKIAVWTYWLWPNLDRYLRLCFQTGAKKEARG